MKRQRARSIVMAVAGGILVLVGVIVVLLGERWGLFFPVFGVILLIFGLRQAREGGATPYPETRNPIDVPFTVAESLAAPLPNAELQAACEQFTAKYGGRVRTREPHFDAQFGSSQALTMWGVGLIPTPPLAGLALSSLPTAIFSRSCCQSSAPV